MTAPRRLLIVNPNEDRDVTRWLGEAARRTAAREVSIEAVNAESGLAAIATPADLARAAAAVARTAQRHPGLDGLIIAAFGDPGLAALQGSRDCPVAGLGTSGLRAAGHGGRRFAVVTLGAAMEQPIRARVAALGLAAGLVDLTILPITIPAFVAARDRQADAIDRAVRHGFNEAGAEAVLLGGAPFAGLADGLAQHLGRPVLDGVAASVTAVLSPREA